MPAAEFHAWQTVLLIRRCAFADELGHCRRLADRNNGLLTAAILIVKCRSEFPRPSPGPASRRSIISFVLPR